ncbi:hypothetical protein Arub01_27690 [Actinomadura rubrobrunea]|uniref:Uncharacterized protein n=1 Tax=Actinomadura rubrobrunea TaxID=115335 RepID=A0A9W6PU73_9ACTN|nr:hypothetical protein Arub01_27690 [Actinomadura rubrobrunea]
MASGAPRIGDAAASHVTPGYQACTSYPSERVKPVTTRLPRLVARGYPGAVPGHLVRSTCLRLIRPVDKPSLAQRAALWRASRSVRRRLLRPPLGHWGAVEGDISGKTGEWVVLESITECDEFPRGSRSGGQ